MNPTSTQSFEGKANSPCLNLCSASRKAKIWHGIRGLSFKDGRRNDRARTGKAGRKYQLICRHRPIILADPGIYAAVSGVRQLAYTSSVGCPYQCNYCTDMVFYKRRFNAYRVDRVVDELADLVPRYDIEHVPLFDSNFLVDRKRAVAIAKGIIASWRQVSVGLPDFYRFSCR